MPVIDYSFRLPIFPIICAIDGLLVSGKEDGTFQLRMKQIKLKPNSNYEVVDATGANWELNTNGLFIFPTMSRKKSKVAIIKLYNASVNCKKIGVKYSNKSLSSKRFEKIYFDIIELLEKSQ